MVGVSGLKDWGQRKLDLVQVTGEFELAGFFCTFNQHFFFIQFRQYEGAETKLIRHNAQEQCLARLEFF